MRMKQLLVWCSLFVSYVPATMAHDFWLEPGQYHAEAPASVSVQFKVGHGDDVTNWNLAWNKIVALRNYTPNGVADMSASIIPKSTLLPGVAKTSKLDAGSYVIGFESYHSVSTLEAEKFSQYAKDEGLTAILQHREANGATGASGTELYSRKAKALVQIGAALTDNVTKPVGHTLEIVPLQHPFKLENSGTLPVQVLFKGEPLEGALIDAVRLDDASHDEQSTKTDSQGKASFTFAESAAIKVNVIWGVPLNNNSNADYETYFSSLTLMVKPKSQ